MDYNNKKIILASNSPRRKELISAMGIDFTVDTLNCFEEKITPEMEHEQIPALMSEGKSMGFHRPLAEDELLITADTMVLCGKEILGKPSGREDAARMLKLLSGREHLVISAVTVRDRKRMKTICDKTAVFFREISDEMIAYYLDNYKPYDKAGAYGVQEWIGYVAISKIEGSFYTVMGLPTLCLHQLLQEFIKY